MGSVFRAIVKSIRVGAGWWFAFSGAALLGSALPLVVGTGGDGVIAAMFLPVGAGLLWLAHRWIGRWAWAIAAVLIGYLGIFTGAHGVAYQGADMGSAGHIAGWLTAVAAIPFAYLAVRGRGNRTSSQRSTTTDALRTSDPGLFG